MIYWFENSCNNVQEVQNFVYLLSTISSRQSGLVVYEQNLRSSVSLFCARVMPKHTWVNDQDRFLHPNLEQEKTIL
jgi:hypothetical protein